MNSAAGIQPCAISANTGRGLAHEQEQEAAEEADHAHKGAAYPNWRGNEVDR